MSHSENVVDLYDI